MQATVKQLQAELFSLRVENQQLAVSVLFIFLSYFRMKIARFSSMLS